MENNFNWQNFHYSNQLFKLFKQIFIDFFKRIKENVLYQSEDGSTCAGYGGFLIGVVTKEITSTLRETMAIESCNNGNALCTRYRLNHRYLLVYS